MFECRRHSITSLYLRFILNHKMECVLWLILVFFYFDEKDENLREKRGWFWTRTKLRRDRQTPNYINFQFYFVASVQQSSHAMCRGFVFLGWSLFCLSLLLAVSGVGGCVRLPDKTSMTFWQRPSECSHRTTESHSNRIDSTWLCVFFSLRPHFFAPNQIQTLLLHQISFTLFNLLSCPSHFSPLRIVSSSSSPSLLQTTNFTNCVHKFWFT